MLCRAGWLVGCLLLLPGFPATRAASLAAGVFLGIQSHCSAFAGNFFFIHFGFVLFIVSSFTIDVLE